MVNHSNESQASRSMGVHHATTTIMIRGYPLHTDQKGASMTTERRPRTDGDGHDRSNNAARVPTLEPDAYRLEITRGLLTQLLVVLPRYCCHAPLSFQG